MTDARWKRSHARLVDAAYELAETRPIAELTASEIAARAGVNRSTFYEHAGSPLDLVVHALRSELDDLRDEFLENAEPEAVVTAVTDVTRAVLDHCDRHAAVYLRNVAELHTMLSDHFQSSTLLLVEHGALSIPLGAESTRAVARYVADGTVGVIAIWLAGPAPRDTGEAMRLLTGLAPAWWPLAPAAR